MAQQDKKQDVQDAKRQDDAARGHQGSAHSMGLQRSTERRGGLAPWRAESPIERMVAEMEWMFDQMHRRFLGAPGFEGMTRWRGEQGGFGRLPHLELEDAGDAIVLNAEIPGVDPKDLQIECRDDVLTIRAESREEESSEESGRFHRYASFYRQVPLPPEADVDHAQASCKNGVLTVRFPKRADTEQVKRIPISGESRREAA